MPPVVNHTLFLDTPFEEEYLSKPWKNPEELFWVGKYASDAYKVFIERRWRDVHPNDHALNWWVEWMRGSQRTEGEEPMAELLPSPLVEAEACLQALTEGEVAGSDAANADHR